jgi:hypothetical protein
MMFDDMFGFDGDYEESDYEAAEGMASGGSFSIGNPSARAGGGYNFRGGAYFPYTHDFACDELSATLNNLGCFKGIEKSNYYNNCLWNAFKSAGVSEPTLQAMKTQFLRRTISRRNIRDIAEQHNLYVEIHTDGDKDVVKYGDPDKGFHVPIACILDHYIHMYRTKFNSYAVEHYDELKDKNEWWTFKDEKRRDKDRGMNSLKLLRAILKTNHVQKISITTHGIFKTQFHDKVKTMEFETLEYPESYSRRFHPKRDGGYDLELAEPINMERLDELIWEIRSIEYALLPDTRNGREKQTEKQKQHNKVRDILDYLYSMKAQCDKGKLNVKYFYKDGIGRLYAKGETSKMRSRSMQGCFSGLRAPLIGHVGHDVDIENSLPVISTQWLDKMISEGVIDCTIDLLKNYTENRNVWLSEVMKYHDCDRDQAKKIVLVVLFGGEPNFKHLKEMPKNQYRPHPWVRKLADELKIVRKTVVDALWDHYKDLIDKKREDKMDEEALYRSVFSILTHEQEDLCMRAIREYVKEMKVIIYSLIHDGLILSECTDELLRGAEQRVFDKTGYSIKLAEKPLYGKQYDEIKELKCTTNIEPLDPESMDMSPRGYVTYNTFLSELFQGREIVLENRSESHLHGVKNYGDCPGLWNKADGDPWDVVVPGYDKRLAFKTPFKVTEVIGALFMKNGNHKTFVKISESGFDNDRCSEDIRTYVMNYPKSVGVNGYWRSDLVVKEEQDEESCSIEEEEEKIENEKKIEKLQKKIAKLRESISHKDPALMRRLDKKIRKLKLGLVEEAKLLARSRPVAANIFFDFEATTKQTHDQNTLIEKCRKQILETVRQPEKVIEKIERKVREDKLDKESEAKLYQQECPHIAYQVCFSEFDEKVVHEYDGSLCAKQILDFLVEKYGCEVSPGEQVDSNDVPVIRMLAHNVTYDMSFLWQYLTRSNYIERGSSIVCGRARYIRFGNEREEGTRKNCPNGDLVSWMQTEGSSIYYNDPELGEGRSMHRGVWEKAVRIVKEHEEYLTEFSDFQKLKGIGKVISSIVQCARFDEFNPTPAFCYDKMVDIRFQDTYKTISMPLSDFGKSFKLDQAKEVMPYDLYTEEFVRNGGMATLEELNAVPNFKDHGDLFMNLVSWGCVVEGEGGERMYDMLKYSRIYCRADVDVLKKGWRVFRDSLLEAFDIDAFHYPTISSIGDAYLTEEGCYEGVHKIAGVPQRFIANASVGGRVMCAENKSVRIIRKPVLKPFLPEDANKEMKRVGIGYVEEILYKTKPRVIEKTALADFDGVSLYPSSMARIPGFLKGAPKVWDASVDLDKVDGYFVKVRVDHVGKKYRFPIARIKDDEGGNEWTNDLEGSEITVDKFTLEDLKRWSKIDYKILQGYYFDRGRNATINRVIQNLFNMRLKYKKEKNPLQIVIKLIMNASYGICGLKPIDVDTRYVKDGEKKDNFVNTHFNRIKHFTPMNNNEWRFELYKEIDTHFNRQHVACEVLSVSKNIMNEVMCTAEDIGAMIHYTDTDSMHIDYDMVRPLAEEFEHRYGRELIGKNLGQFHTDFEFSTSYSNVDGTLVPCKTDSVGDIRAVESIFLGKKSYIDLLEDEAGNTAYHIRLKGIPAKCIMHKVSTEYGGDPMAMFNDLFEGKVVEYDLSAGGAVMFRVNKNHTMSTVAMTRKVQFVNGELYTDEEP